MTEAGQVWQEWVPSTDPDPLPVVTGPASPLPLMTAPPALPIRSTAEVATCWVVGAHGGSGESTLATLVENWRAADHEWPHTVPTSPCLLVARTSADGLLAAQAAMAQWAAGDAPVDLVGLVLLADAPGTLPRPLRELAALVAGGAPRHWSIPWIEQWRLGEPHITRDVARLIRHVTAIIPTDTWRTL